MKKKDYSLCVCFVIFVMCFFGFVSINKVYASEVTPDEISEVNESNESLEQTTPTSENTSTSVDYESHVQDKGWQEEKKDGEVSGTTGESKRIEAVNIQLENQEYQGNINYQAHVQDIGWQTTVWGGQVAGTTGQSKRLEAIRIWLTGDIANYYSIQYRAHIQDIGWQDWACDGIIAGTTGLGKRLEALQIRLVRINNQADPEIHYTSHVQDYGWQSNKTDGQISGTPGQSKRVEAFTVGLNNSKYSGDVIYQAHVQDIGWQNWVKNGQVAGTTGLGKSLQAICIALTGNIANDYSIYYRVHSRDFGWLDWASDGNVAGTTGLGKAIEAIQIHLMKKIDLKALETNSEVSSICDRKGYKNGVAVTGWKNINGDSYYFGNDGVLVVNQSIKKDDKQGYVNNLGKFVLSNNGIFMHGIDISEWNYDIDLTPYKDNFVIIRLGWYNTLDKKALRNIQLCEQLGIPYGVYLYSYATSIEESRMEANFVLNQLSHCSNLRVGVWYDMEDADNYKANRGSLVGSLMTNMCNTFCSILQNAGYYTGVYSSSSWFNYYLTNLNTNIPKWVAHWDNNDGQLHSNLSNMAVLHQYTSIPLDQNVMYVPLETFKLK